MQGIAHPGPVPQHAAPPFRRERDSRLLVRDGHPGVAYSDGAGAEAALLALLKRTTDLGTGSAELAAAIVDWPTEAHLSGARANLLRPFRFDASQRILELGSGCGALTRFLGETGARVDAVEGAYARARCCAERVRDLPNVDVHCDDLSSFAGAGQYDLVTLIGVLEYSRLFVSGEDPVVECLRHARRNLKPGGALVLAIENQLGLAYFNGCHEDHVGARFAGLTGLYGARTPVTFGRAELGTRLVEAGFAGADWYFPFPDYKTASIVIAQRALAVERFAVGDLLFGEASRDHSGSALRSFDESGVWPVLAGNGLVAELANAFLVVARTGASNAIDDGSWLAHKYATSRVPRFAVDTCFSQRSGDTLVVTKRSLFPGVQAPATAATQGLEHHLADGPYVEGRLLARDIGDAVGRSEHLRDIAAAFRPWLAHLLAHVDDAQRATRPWTEWRLPGHLLDCVPFNLIRTGEDNLVPIDLEFSVEPDVPLAWVVMRGVVHTISKCFGHRALADVSSTTLLDEIVRQLELPPLADWAPFCELEDRLIRDVLLPWPGRGTSGMFAARLRNPATTTISAWSRVAEGGEGRQHADDARVEALVDERSRLIGDLAWRDRRIDVLERERAAALAAAVRSEAESGRRAEMLAAASAAHADLQASHQQVERELRERIEAAAGTIAHEREAHAGLVRSLERRCAEHERAEASARAEVQRADEALREAERDLARTAEALASLDREAGTLRQALEASGQRERATDERLRNAAEEARRREDGLAGRLSEAAAESQRREDALAARLREVEASKAYRLMAAFGLAAPVDRPSSPHGGLRERGLFRIARIVYRSLPAGQARTRAKNAFYGRFGHLFRNTQNYQVWHMERSTAAAPLPAPPVPPPPSAWVDLGAKNDGAPMTLSVVIPAYGNAAMTRACIESLRAAGTSVPTQIIVVDDASPEPLVDALGVDDHVEVLRNERNTGFVGACNRGAAHARGTHLMFLNNDTEVRPGALAAMLRAFDDADVGVAGCKLVFPDGRLQEAGAYVRPDGSAEMIGLWDDPARPRYGFAREVGYASGAALMIERELFARLGGFDTAFAPAYCEDSDLCYRVRASGRKVVYTPDATVVHALSASMQHASIDKSALVARNQQTFLARWAPTLARDDHIRALAFYLPQYHPIPENDRWWGAGFTEWTNVVRSQPLFQGHQQPTLPADLGFYDLRLPDARALQADLARSAGIHGFCYYGYWFAGTRLLNAPLDAVIASGTPDFPFCVCWANENWTRRWDGLDSEILIAQQHSPEDDVAFLTSLFPAFRDRRYVRVDGKPVLLVYRPSTLPDARATAQRWRDHARRSGIGELYLLAVQSFLHVDGSGPDAYGFDGAVEFPPHSLAVPASKPQKGLTSRFEGMLYDYPATRESFLNREPPAYKLFRTVMPRWDNTPRRGVHSNVFVDTSPEAYRDWLARAVEYTRRMYFGDERLLFINAWNEWGEGNFLEPDRQHGHAYLDATRQVLRPEAGA